MKRISTYADAGVDVEASNITKDKIKSLVRSTFTKGVLSDVGSFGGLFAVDWKEYREPVLVSSVDSVGTKLKVAFRANIHNTVGIDIVAHCVNDILVQGAKPLFFMDYIAMGKHRTEVVVEIISGLAEGCREARCVLLGGEMAELPDFYQPGEYDLAGTIVGIVDKQKIIAGSHIAPGDILLGLASNGLHTNGYSLARKLIFDVARLDIDSFVDEFGCTVGEELLKIHRCYAKSILELLSKARIEGMAHITGGGMTDNIPRILPHGTAAEINLGSWPVPAVFSIIQRLGEIDETEMLHTFNMGIGLVLVVRLDQSESVKSFLHATGEKVYEIGRIVSGARGTIYRGGE